jgi:hypothetical protein
MVWDDMTKIDVTTKLTPAPAEWIQWRRLNTVFTDLAISESVEATLSGGNPEQVPAVLALVTSAVFFASLHLFRPLPLDPALATYYRAALMAKYTVAGAVLGWVFWRWGLPYAILCHALVNATHTALEQFVFL